MANEQTVVPGPAWYIKIFTYLKNHNRVGPEKVELPDCDFFIVAPRRALRILKPPLKSGWFYETTNERPESINDNFFARWSRRPHPSGNCRCSFRQSSRLSTTEEQIISAEINRIRTSLCEAERTGQDIEELEQRISVNLENLIPVTIEPKTERNVDDKLAEIADVELVKDDRMVEDERAAKKKIVEGLEKYINGLLEEILSDTMRLVAESEDSEPSNSSRDSRKSADPGLLESIDAKIESCKVPADEGTVDSFNISFAFHSDERKEDPKEGDQSEGYVNQAFIGSASDPDSLNFYLRRPVGCGNVTNCVLEHLDCVDSGINSVETVEFQPDQEPSLEESLMEIIDAKLGRGPLRKSWQDLSSGAKDLREDVIVEGTVEEDRDPRIESTPERLEVEEEKAEGADRVEPGEKEHEHVAKSYDVVDEVVDWNRSTVDSFDSYPSKDLEEETNEPSFERLRLEFNDKSLSEKASIKRLTGLSLLRRKLGTNFGAGCKNYEDSRNDGRVERGKLQGSSRTEPVELNDYRKRWSELEESCSSLCEQNPHDFVVFRKNRKPTIVFLHGFGSSAEIFNHQLEYFSNLGYPCIAPDMLGHGMSSAPNRACDYRFDKLLKDLDVILHHYAFKPGQKCVLVAHNYGCSFATALACKYDSSIHQLVLISGGGPTALAPPSTESVGHCCLRTIVAPLLMCGLRREILYSARGRQHPYCGPETKEQWPSHMKYVLDGMVWPEGDYVFHRRICTPTLLIHGLRDNKVSLVQECQMERTMMKAFLEAIPAAGHSPMTDCPDQLNHMIQCFIDLWKNKKW